jgi:hypothetical protein
MTPFQAWLFHHVWNNPRTQAHVLVCTGVCLLLALVVVIVGSVIGNNLVILCAGIVILVCLLWVALGCVLMFFTRRWEQECKAQVLPQ